MRNKDRIRPICERLATAWERFPDMRLLQLICNAYAGDAGDPFFIEDDKLIEMIEEFVKVTPYHPPTWAQNYRDEEPIGGFHDD